MNSIFSVVLLQGFLICHSALDAESSFFVFSGFLLEFIPHFDAGQE